MLPLEVRQDLGRVEFAVLLKWTKLELIIFRLTYLTIIAKVSLFVTHLRLNCWTDN